LDSYKIRFTMRGPMYIKVINNLMYYTHTSVCCGQKINNIYSRDLYHLVPRVAKFHVYFLISSDFMKSDRNVSFTFISNYVKDPDKWVSVTTTWRVLRLRLEEQPPIWRVVASILNKQLRAADKWWSSSLGVGRVANNSSP
jgi:hypothetical protein